jgi:hypothetical protein
MRHLGSIVLSMILAPLIYVLGGVGIAKFAKAIDGRTAPDFVPAILSLGALLLAGVLYAILTMTRVSPLGPVLAGVGFLAVGFWALADPATLGDTLPQDVLGVRDAGILAAGPLALLISVPLLATIVSPRRWRRRDGVEAPTHGEGDRTYAGYGAAEAGTPAYLRPASGPPRETALGFPPTAPDGPPHAHPPGYPRIEPTMPTYPTAGPTSPAYPRVDPNPPTYPTRPGGAEFADAAEETRPLPTNPASDDGRSHPPSDSDATHRL